MEKKMEKLRNEKDGKKYTEMDKIEDNWKIVSLTPSFLWIV